jgi:hypothetical protein
MKITVEGFVAVGFSLGTAQFVLQCSNSTADKLEHLIQTALELRLSAQDQL